MEYTILKNSLVHVMLAITDDTDLADFIEERNNPVVRITEVEEIDGAQTGLYWGEIADTKEPIPYVMKYEDICLV